MNNNQSLRYFPEPVDRNRMPADSTGSSRPVHAPQRRAEDQTGDAWLSLMLDEIDYGMFLIDIRRRILHANRAALAQLKATPSLVSKDRELSATDPGDASALAAAIRAAATQNLRRMLMIGRHENRLAVSVVPLPLPVGGAEANVLLCLSRQHICETLSAHGFARDHGLSGAEAKVLQALCLGMPPAKIAVGQGVAVSTVRTQINNIRLKTNAASIRELVHRVAQLPPIVTALRGDARLEA